MGIKTLDITPAMQKNMPAAVRVAIERLQRQIEEQDRLIRELKTIGDRDTEAGIIVDPYSEHPQVIPVMKTLRFWVEPGVFAIDVCMRPGTTRRKQAGIHVSGWGARGGSLIAVAPVAANVVDIYKDDDL